jgi:hypothetical protein
MERDRVVALEAAPPEGFHTRTITVAGIPGCNEAGQQRSLILDARRLISYIS